MKSCCDYIISRKDNFCAIDGKGSVRYRSTPKWYSDVEESASAADWKHWTCRPTDSEGVGIRSGRIRLKWIFIRRSTATAKKLKLLQSYFLSIHLTQTLRLTTHCGKILEGSGFKQMYSSEKMVHTIPSHILHQKVYINTGY